MTNLCSIIEALLFVSGEPLETDELARATQSTQLEIAAALGELEAHYEKSGSGIRLERVNERVYLCTHRRHAQHVANLLQPQKTRAFSQAMMETLSVIAYKQPVTRAEIEAVRGVRCEYAVRELIAMDMVREVGRKETLGRPALLGTTDAFLRHFGLTSLSELPERALFESASGAGEQSERDLEEQAEERKPPEISQGG